MNLIIELRVEWNRKEQSRTQYNRIEWDEMEEME